MSEDGRPDDALRTPWQIRTADLDRLREDDRLWAAYERGWCDFLQMYLDSKLMQGETDYITLHPGDADATAGGHRDRAATAAVARDPRPPSADSPAPSTDADDSAPTSSDVTARLTSSSSAAEDAVVVDDSQQSVVVDGDEEPRPNATGRRRRQRRDRRRSAECAETASPSGSDGGGSASAGGYASDDSSRDADSEVRRFTFGDTSADSFEAVAVRSFSAVRGPSADDSAGSSE